LPESVLGRNFFTQVAPCTNNFMVAERYVENGALDAVIDYVFTYKMKPTKIRLRLLKRDGGDSQFLLVLKA
jgi:photoactive yellow protein